MSLSRRAATELCRTGAFWSPATSQSPAADRLRAHQARGEERPSALPPVLLAVHLPADRRPAREARQLQHVLLPPARLRRGARRLGGESTYTLHCRPGTRWRGSAAPTRSRRASSPTRPRCPSRFASPCACSAAANPTSCPRTRPRSCPRSCGWSRAKSWSRRRRRPRKPTRARLWRVHVALTTSKQLWRCVRHQCALQELKRSAIQRQRDLTYRY